MIARYIPGMPDPASPLTALFDAPARPGRLLWIGLRPARREPMVAVREARLVVGEGLTGDRHGRGGGARQVTLIQAESLAAIASHLGREAVEPQDLRRNLVVRGLNLIALKGRRFMVGEAVLETSGECHPCSRMEAALGAGGYNAVRGLGGITARVIEGGVIAIGDAVVRVDGDR
jgi:MOSC domain-containing protein YiiM